MDKVEYVKAQTQTRNHTCHWPNCKVQVPPAMWGCNKHWFKLPVDLRNKIWKTYVPGQEITLTPSAEYLHVVDEVNIWIANNNK